MYSLLLAVIYLAFISLGLPDSLLGAAWPTMYIEFGVPVSYAGAVSVIIALGTVLSALFGDRLIGRLGTGRVTAFSVALTAAAMLGFSLSGAYWQLCFWAVPYGLGAGCVDAALNNYVALHYKSRHMNLLHCMWGLGASIGPYIMGWALSGGSWNAGYRTIAIFQAALSAVLFLSLPLWKRPAGGAGEEAPTEAVPKRELLRLPGAKAILVAFLCYQAVENTVGIWASSYLVLHRGLAEAEAAKLASLFYIGITAGRGLCGFVNLRLSDDGMIRLGQGVVLVGLALLFIPGSSLALYLGLGLVGLGCAPIYPSIIHSTPEHFGASRSQSMIGLEMACAYVGTTAAPPLFGLIANHLSIALFPAYLLAFLALMFVCHELLVKRAGAAK